MENQIVEENNVGNPEATKKQKEQEDSEEFEEPEE